MTDVQTGFEIVHVIAKGNPFPKQAVIVDAGHQWRWPIDEGRDVRGFLASSCAVRRVVDRVLLARSVLVMDTMKKIQPDRACWYPARSSAPATMATACLISFRLPPPAITLLSRATARSGLAR